ncbi:MAG: DUF1428 domain-containing protein [Henriciella sp.]|jgi:uncharacterized protein YbaA (DUF1428 family)|nr:DUF1428 domain-containing protein [Henriciella sp.]
MTYVDGFVFAVPAANKDEFRKHAEEGAVLFKRHGAISVMECWGDDVPEGETNSFHTAVMRKPDEVVMFSFVTWPDKATRDAGNEKVFIDMQAADYGDAMPFDGTRMIYGGFQALVEA